MTTDTPPSEPGRAASRTNRPVPLVIGILRALVGLPLLIGGLGLGWAMATQRDDDGFFSTPTVQLTDMGCDGVPRSVGPCLWLVSGRWVQIQTGP